MTQRQQKQQQKRSLRKRRRNFYGYVIGLKISFIVCVIVTSLYTILHINTRLFIQQQQFQVSSSSASASASVSSTTTSATVTTSTSSSSENENITRHNEHDNVEDHNQRPSLLLPQKQEVATVRLGNNVSSIPTYIQDMITTTTTTTTSDFVELDHCLLNRVNWNEFTNWSQPIITKTTQDFLKRISDTAAATAPASSSSTLSSYSENSDLLRPIQNEWTLQLLEMYATYHGYCDFTTKYRPKAIFSKKHSNDERIEQQVGKRLQHIVETVPIPPKNHVRIVYCIIAYRDVSHLKRLIQAIHLPHHIIIIHLDDDTDSAFRRSIEVQILQQHYSNVVMLQFGTVIYKTDSVSMINLRIMEYIHNTLNIQYDYYVTLGGATYPLLRTSTELSNYLYNKKQEGQQQHHHHHRRNLGGNVWLGELYHKGQKVEPEHHSQVGVLLNKRLLTSSSTLSKFLSSTSVVSNVTLPNMAITPATNTKRLKFQQRIGFIFGSSLLSSSSSNTSSSSIIEDHMKYKSVSGNQAIFSYGTIHKLLHNPNVLQLFAISKYGCCCCIEERTWIAAMSILDNDENNNDGDDGDDNNTSLLQEALHNTAIFQVWGGGGSSSCRGSMNNAILSQNSSTCFRIEHPPPQQRLQEQQRQQEEGNYSWPHSSRGRGGPKDPTSVYFWGNTTMEILHHAKDHGGYLFARKFDSNNPESMELLTTIMKSKTTST